MSFGEELTKINTDLIGEVFDDLIAAPAQPGAAELDSFAFMQGEVIRSDRQFPVFAFLMEKYKAHIPDLLEDGIMTEEQLKGVMTGIYVTQIVLSGYAEREAPDITFPPEPS